MGIQPSWLLTAKGAQGQDVISVRVDGDGHVAIIGVSHAALPADELVRLLRSMANEVEDIFTPTEELESWAGRDAPVPESVG